MEEKEREIVELNQKYVEDMAAIKDEHIREIAELNEEHDGEIAQIKADFADELAQTIEEHETRVAELTDQIDDLNATLEQTVSDFEEKNVELDRQLNDLDAARQRVIDECAVKIQQAEEGFNKDIEKLEKTQRIELKKLRDENALIRGELDGIRAQQGKLTPSADYTSRDRFIELEEEYMAYHRFFKTQWEFTKKEIRKTILWTKQEKKDKKKK